MAPIDHHHRSTTKSAHKSFKTKHASKSELKDRAKGKIGGAAAAGGSEEKGKRRTPSQQVMSKIERKNHARPKREVKGRQHEEARSVFQEREGAPRICAVVPLCVGVNGGRVRRGLEGAARTVDASEEQSGNVNVGEMMDDQEEGWTRFEAERFRQKIQWLVVRRDLVAVLDACRVADFVILALSATEEVDEQGEMLLRCIEGQGVSNVFVVVQGLGEVEAPKRRQQVTASLKSFVTHFFPTVERVHSVDSRQESLNLVRSLCMTTPKSVRWREDRSWMVVEDVRWPSGKLAANGEEATGEVIMTGVVRGKSLKADRLVHVGDWGDYQIDKITAAPLERKKKATEETMAIDGESAMDLLDQPTAEQDDLAEMAPEEVKMDDAADIAVSIAPSERKGVLLDDHHYFSDEDTRVELPKPKRLPKGTSKYQAAWYLEDVSDSDAEYEDMDEEDSFDGNSNMNGSATAADGTEGFDLGGPAETEGAPSEYPQSEMFLDPAPEDEIEELEAYRDQRKAGAEEDLEFPDEIELQLGVQARERLARYRGLKSLRTSHWETEEDKPHQPSEWDRLLEVADYKGAKSRVLREALIGGVKPGTRVSIHLKSVPLSLQQSHNPLKPLSLFSLLRHEHKRAALNYSITLSSELTDPVKSKEELIMQCGPRRLVINPLFSQAGNTPNDVHKFDRYLHPGRTAIASFIGPLTWGFIPTLFFRRSIDSTSGQQKLQLIGTGTSLPPSQNRVIAKRIVLTGHPYKIHKKLVTVRYMFFNAEDIAWFKALQLWTKRGRSGFIKESLGTHGYFKATFDGKINPQDAVGVSLYNRVWPRSAGEWKPWEEQEQGQEEEVTMLVDGGGMMVAEAMET